MKLSIFISSLICFIRIRAYNPLFIKNRYGKIKIKQNFVIKSESHISKFIGTKYSLGVNSGGMALTISLLAIKQKYNLTDNYPIFTNSFTFNAVPSSIVNAKLSPYLIETDSRLLLNLTNLEEHIINSTNDVHILLLSYMRGRIPDMGKLSKIVKKYNIILIEDCAHAYGCKWKKKMIGTFGEVSIISTQANKLISTGEGGFILSNDDDIMAISMIATGCYENLNLKHYNFSPPNYVYQKYKYIIPNFSARMTLIQGYLFDSQFHEIKNTIKHFNKNYYFLRSLNKNKNIIYIEQDKKISPVYDSLQLKIENITDEEFELFLEKLNSLGNYNFQSFLSEDNARFYKNWQFFTNNIQLNYTDINLKHICDVRLYHDYTFNDLRTLQDNIDRAYLL